MIKKETLSYKGLLDELNLPHDTQSLIEEVLSKEKETDEEESNSLELFNKLREKGLSGTEINLLATLSENINLKRVIEDVGGIDNLSKVSPAYWMKEKLNTANKELNDLKNKMRTLEESSKELIQLKKKLMRVESDLLIKQNETENLAQTIEMKEHVIENLNQQIADILLLNKQLQLKPNACNKNKTVVSDFYNDETLEEYRRVISEKDKEIYELKKKEEEYDELLRESIADLQSKVYEVVDKKQIEWDECYAYLNEQRRNELLTLQEKHVSEIGQYKQKIEELINQKETGGNKILRLFEKINSKLQELR